MAKHRNPNVVAFTALGTAYGEATANSVAVKSPVEKRVAESRARGIKDSLALLFETLPAKANRDWYETVALRAANAVRAANGLDKLDSLLLAREESEIPTQKKTTPAPKTGKTAASAPTTREAKPTRKSTPKLDRYDIDEGTQCLGITKGGTQCRHWAINGTGYCLQHQGQVPDAEATTEAPKTRKSKTTQDSAASTPVTTDAAPSRTASTQEAKPTRKKQAPKESVKESGAHRRTPKALMDIEAAMAEAKSAASTPTTQEAKPRTKSTREKLLEKRLAEKSALSEAEMAEAQAEADFLAEAKLQTAKYTGSAAAAEATIEALRASDI